MNDDETQTAQPWDPNHVSTSMTPEQRERYENLSHEGKAYVNEQMNAYDSYCADHPEPNC